MAIALLTGSPGVGKTATCYGLRDLGFPGYDIDEDGLATPLHNVTNEPASYIGDTNAWHDTYSWQLDESKLQVIKDRHARELAFISGTVTDDFRLWHMFDIAVALVASKTTVWERLITRTNHTFGKAPEERQRVIDNMDDKYARYRMMGAIMIDAEASLKTVIERTLHACQRC